MCRPQLQVTMTCAGPRKKEQASLRLPLVVHSSGVRMKHHFAGRVGRLTPQRLVAAIWIVAVMLYTTRSTCVAEQPVGQPTPLEILAQAEQIAQSLPTYERDFASSLATSRARAGDLDGALERVDKIRFIPYRQGTLTGIARIIHQRGDPTKARKLLADFADRLLRGDFPDDDDPTLRFLSPQVVEVAHKRMVIESLRDIARAQSEMGDPQAALDTCRNALKLIEQIEAPQRAVNFRDIAVDQARAKDVAAALQTAEKISDPSSKDEAIGLISQAQAETGDWQGALRSVERITGGGYSAVMALMTIAHAQVQNGQFEQARATAQLAKATKSFDRQQAESVDDDVAGWIVQAQLRTGDLPGANETLQSIKNPRFKSLAVGSIARWQGSKGDLKGALATLLAVDPPTDDTLRALAEMKAMSGDSAGALQNAKQISDPTRRMMAYFEIASAQAKAGDMATAAKSLDAALKASRGLQPYQNPSQFYGHAAIIHAKMGEYNRAVERALAVGPEFRPRFLTEIAKMRTKAGDVAGAVEMAKQLGSSADQVNALIGVAEGLMNE